MSDEKQKDIVLFEADKDVYGSSATIRQCLSLPVSLLSLREHLTNKDYSVEVLTQGTLSDSELAKKILDYRPKIVGATASCCEYPATSRVMNEIKKQNQDIITTVGGYHASSYPLSIDSNYCPIEVNPRGIDYLVVSEGEETLLELANSTKEGNLKERRNEIKGLVYMIDGRIHQTEKRILNDVNDFSDIHCGDNELSQNSFDGLMISPNQGKVAVIISERGCPYACSFCSTQNVYGRSVRTKSIERLGKEIEKLVRQKSVDMVVDYAPTANRDQRRIHEFAEEIRRRGLAQKFSLYHLWRLEHPTTGELMISDEVLGDISQTFFAFKAGVGVESLSEKDQHYIHKAHSLDSLLQASRSFDRHGGMLRGFFMVTPETTKESIETCKTSELMALFDDLRVTYLVPFPGSPMYEEHKKDLITEDWSKFASQEPVLKSNHLTVEDLKNASRDITQGFLKNQHRQKRIADKIRRFPKLRKAFDRYHKKMREYGFDIID